jgi:hypothetical protein
VQAYRWLLVRDALARGAADGPGAADAAALRAGLTPAERGRAERMAAGWAPPIHDYALRAPYAFEPVPLSEATVRRAQAALVAAGLEPGPVDGVFSDATARAIVDYEALDGTPASAAITHHLIESLRIHQEPAEAASCATAWLDQQPADPGFAMPPAQATDSDSGPAADALAGAGEAAIPDASDSDTYDGEAADDAGDGEEDETADEDSMAAPATPQDILDKVIANNEAMLRHQLINDAQREFAAAAGAAGGVVGDATLPVCASPGDFIAALRSAALGPAAGPAQDAEGCYHPAIGTPARVLGCADPDAYICELELKAPQDGQGRRGWSDLGILE